MPALRMASLVTPSHVARWQPMRVWRDVLRTPQSCCQPPVRRKVKARSQMRAGQHQAPHRLSAATYGDNKLYWSSRSAGKFGFKFIHLPVFTALYVTWFLHEDPHLILQPTPPILFFSPSSSLSSLYRSVFILSLFYLSHMSSCFSHSLKNIFFSKTDSTLEYEWQSSQTLSFIHKSVVWPIFS